MSGGISGKLVRILRDYLESYRRGCEHFGFWWRLFTASMFALTLALVFVSLAVILALKFLV